MGAAEEGGVGGGVGEVEGGGEGGGEAGWEGGEGEGEFVVVFFFGFGSFLGVCRYLGCT